MSGVAWSDKVSVKEAMLFFSDWKTREELMSQYNLTPMQAWKVVKYLETKRIMRKKVPSRAGNPYAYKMREEYLDKIEK